MTAGSASRNGSVALAFPAMTRLTLLIAGFALLVAACGGDEASDAPPASFPEDAFAVRASTDIGLGSERLLIGIGDDTGARLGSPDDAIVIEVAPESDPSALQTQQGSWTWIVPNAVGLYRATFDFDAPGLWVATVTPQGREPLESVIFNVAADPFAPGLGEMAPVVATPTLSDHSIEELTTDPNPQPSFYELSLDQAVASSKPTVLVFSTPAYCRTSACGPLLEHVKDIAPDHPDVNFIHVEVFTGLTDPDFAPDAAHLAPAVGPDFYNLPSEPWVFVIDESGTVTARFEGVMDPAELTAILP